MKNILILFFLAFSFRSFGISEILKNDNFIMGQPSSGSSKNFSFNFGLGALNPKFSSLSGSDLQFNIPFIFNDKLDVKGNTLTVGDGTNTDKFLIFDKGAGASNPAFKYNSTSGALTFNNGVVEKKIGSGSGGGGGGVNLLSDKNAGFEDGKLVWVESGLTYSITQYINASASDLQYASLVGTVAAQTLTSTTVNLPDNFGIGCEAQVEYNAPSGDQSYTLKVFNGATLLGSQILTGTGSWQKSSILPFACASTMKVVIETSGVANISIDNVYLGSTRGLLDLQQSSVSIGYAKWIPSAGCIWARTSTVFASFAPVSGCVLPTGSNLKGAAVAPSTKIPAIKIPLLKAGLYNVVVSAAVLSDGIANASGSCVISDGITFSGRAVLKSSTSGGGSDGTMVGIFSYESDQSNIQFEIQCAVSTGTAFLRTSANDRVDGALTFNVVSIPIGEVVNQTYAPSVTDFLAEGLLTTTDNTEILIATTTPLITKSTLQITNNTANMNIVCSDGSIGTPTCTGIEITGVAVDVPVSGVYKVRAGYTVGANLNVGTNWRLNKITSTGTIISASDEICSQYNQAGSGESFCSQNYILNMSAGRHYFAVGNGFSGGSSYIPANPANGRGIKFTVELVGQNIARPIIQNMVETSVGSGVRIESCKINNNGVATTDSISGLCSSWISSVTRTALGSVILNIKTGIFKLKTVCTCSVNVGSAAGRWCQMNPSATKSQVNISTANTGVLADYDFNIQCTGVK